jgi:hypothetical protein
VRRGGGEGNGGKRGEVAIWGKWLGANLEGDGAYVEPSTFCHRMYSQL